MSLPIKDILGILSDNLRLRESVIPLSKRQISGWADGLGIKEGGETIIYTGHMYQLIPYIKIIAEKMADLENSPLTRYFWMGRIANRAINLASFMGKPLAEEQTRYNNYLRNIAMLLKEAGVDFGYLYSNELYTGALIFDHGIDHVFEAHAHRVYQVLKENGTRRIITVDPHTTNMLRTIYPKFIKGYDLEVKSYLEVLCEKRPETGNPLDIDLAIHDSCVYARHEGITKEPRLLLERAGARLHESELSERLTHCCGGPIESLFPSKAHEIAKRRMEQLAACSDNITTMCPICLINLKKAAKDDINVTDISEYLAMAYCKKDN
ncbi:MAG: (Fe-S)-binding protein [Dissulfurimicrobium sp.]|uniref:(Fe-S)-binding protein n=1 Tax=Dissulfurimicrobium sp. TaxID=2022436 RepID=UPI00404AC6C1